MAIFGKKISLDEILKGIDALSPEEKEKVKAKMEDLDKAEDEREIDKIEEEKADDAEVKDEKGEEKEKESEEIGKNVDEVKEEVEDKPDDTQQDKLAADNSAEVIKGLSDRLSALEEKFKDFDDLKKLMEEFTEKQAKQYGYQGAVPGGKKPVEEMSAAELKKSILNGEI